MARRNIYLQDALDADVQRYALPVSEICQDALQAAVRQRSAQSLDDGELATAASRLLADREAEDRESYDEGFAIGRAWAMDEAKWSELVRFEPHRGRPRDLILLDEDHGLRRALFSWAISRDYDVEEDWFQKLDRDTAFDRGVIDGATNVLAAVLPLVEGRASSDE